MQTTEMSPEEFRDADWRTRGMAWLANQGVSTVLLLGLCVGIWIRVPDLLNSVQSGFDKNADEHNKIAEKYLEAARISADATKSFLDTHRRESVEHRRLIIELIKRSDITAKEFQEAVDVSEKAAN